MLGRSPNVESWSVTSALGEVGDFLLQNDHIRVVIQDKGFSRGFGIYVGSLIDVDLVRPTKPGTSAGGRGKDQFGELFPVAFLQALVPDSVRSSTMGAMAKAPCVCAEMAATYL